MSIQRIEPKTDPKEKSGQICMRSTRMYADIMAIASHRLTDEQKEALQEIALQISTESGIDMETFEVFRKHAQEISQDDLKGIHEEMETDRKIIEKHGRGFAGPVKRRKRKGPKKK